MRTDWSGVFPAVTTQFREDYELDLERTREVIAALLAEGVDGLVVCGTVGEGCSLTGPEKREVIAAAVDVAAGRVPVLVGVAEYTTALAAQLAHDSAGLGADGLMVLPAMVYGAKPEETIAHFEGVAAASRLPIMVYNNPPAYRVDITPKMAAELAQNEKIVSIKESSGDTARFVDLANELGEELALFCGLDDVVVESVALGAVGWVSGMSNVFPAEANRLFRLAREGRRDEALTLYKWFMPLLHLDARHDLVQCIKLCEAIAGRGSETTRPPRLPLAGVERDEVSQMMERALATRPALNKVA